jgi:hypothetical protein
VTAGTALHRTRAGLSKWFLAVYLMARAAEQSHVACRAWVVELPRQFGDRWWAIRVSSSEALALAPWRSSGLVRSADQPRVGAVPRDCARLGRPESVRDDPMIRFEKFGQHQRLNRQAERYTRWIWTKFRWKVLFWRPNEDQHFSIFDLHGIARQPTVHRIDSDAGIGDVKLPKMS